MPRDGTPTLRRIRRRGKLRQTWYIQYFENGKRHFISTHTRDRSRAEIEFAKFIAARTSAQSAVAPQLNTPDRISLRSCLLAYLEDVTERRVLALRQMEQNISHVDDHFGEQMVSIVTRSTCLGYAKARRRKK